jgi:hypothetical protein
MLQPQLFFELTREGVAPDTRIFSSPVHTQKCLVLLKNADMPYAHKQQQKTSVLNSP